MKFLIVIFFLFSFSAQALPVQIDNLPDGWMAHALEKSDAATILFGDAEALINLHETNQGSEATIAVYALPQQKGSFGEGTSSWRRALFIPKLEKRIKIFSERTYQVDGHWRYVIEYSLNNGTSLRSMAMVTEYKGKLHAFMFELSEKRYIRLASSVRNLFQKISFN